MPAHSVSSLTIQSVGATGGVYKGQGRNQCGLMTRVYSHYQLVHGVVKILDLRCGNDPSAGSPTETLLRLHLPLNDKDWTSSRGQVPMKLPGHNLEASPDHSIGRCDGRCVQRAGT